MIYALVAPRPLMMSTALHDPVENTWGIERVFEQVQEVYKLLGRPENIGLRYRPGPHAPDAGAYAAHNEFLLRAIEGKSITESFPYRPPVCWSDDLRHSAGARMAEIVRPYPRASHPQRFAC
jgi:hypothetical protein